MTAELTAAARITGILCSIVEASTHIFKQGQPLELRLQLSGALPTVTLAAISAA
jgi:type III secretory pathway component EscS